MTIRDLPHRRFDPLKREWVLVSPHRMDRPWQGQHEPVAPRSHPAYDPSCYLCPGNRRHSGAQNPGYESTFVFDNDFPALFTEKPEVNLPQHDLLRAEAESGVCRVVCFSPDHGLTLARMSVGGIRKVINTLTSEFEQLMARPEIRHVQIFENCGEMMGCSNPHPHCQIWATQSIPNEVARERASMADYQETHSSCLLCDYGDLEHKLAERVVCETESFLAVVPFWAVWPFEILLISRRHVAGFSELAETEKDDLASMLQKLGMRYDRLFDVPFPYTMGFHQGAAREGAHLHAHYYPPLLRSGTVRKFLVGFEMLAMPQRDLTPESAAERLRNIHD